MSYIVGNWKMHGALAPEASGNLAHDAIALAKAIAAHDAGDNVVVLCPPSTLLLAVAHAVYESNIHTGGQDCHTHTHGAFTGNISAEMLKDAGAGYVILGHSERRQYEQESDALVRSKAEAAIAAGLTAIVCVGETLEQREAGEAEKVVRAQLAASLPEHVNAGTCLVAYEPVWAIGTGKVPSIEDIAAMHSNIADATGGIPALYGGSVKPGNAAEILAIDYVDGVLVGGACLNAGDFTAIIDAA